MNSNEFVREGWLRLKVLRSTHFLDVKADRKGGRVRRPTAKKLGTSLSVYKKKFPKPNLT